MTLINVYDIYDENKNISFWKYAYNCIDNKFKDIFKKENLNQIFLNTRLKDNLYLLDIIPSKEEGTLMRIIVKVPKKNYKTLFIIS